MPSRDTPTAQDAVDFLESIGMRVEGDAVLGPAMVFDLRGERIEVVGMFGPAELVDLATYEKAVEASRNVGAYDATDGAETHVMDGARSDESMQKKDPNGESDQADLSVTELLNNGWEIGRGSTIDVEEGAVDWMVEESEESDGSSEAGGSGEGDSLNPGDESVSFDEW